MTQRRQSSFLRRAAFTLLALWGAGAVTLALFLVLPLLQAISKGPQADWLVREVDAGYVPPPPPPPEEEPEPEEEEQEEAPPELTEEAPPLDLSQLELALGPSFGDGWMGADFSVQLDVNVAAGAAVDALFSLSDLDQRPRPVYQPSPVMTSKLRSSGPATVNVIFIVDEQGRVVDPKVQSSTDPQFDRPALKAISKWKFDPGKRNGKAVATRIRQPITFPGGGSS